MKVWLVTHTNSSDEKFYYKVQAESREAAKAFVAEKYHLYPFMLTTVRGERATIYQTMHGTYEVLWEREEYSL